MKETRDFLNNLFDYDNYRTFLSDYLSNAKTIRTSLSKRNFARKAGFSSHGFLVYIIQGKRNITDKSMSNFVKALGLNKKQQAYFETLVKFNQAKTTDQREFYYKKLNSLRDNSQFFKLHHESHYLYLRQWYYPVVREVCVLLKSCDPAIIANSITPRITKNQAKIALRDLLKSGLLGLDQNGDPVTINPLLSGEGIPPYIFNKIKKDYIFKAIESIGNFPPHERHICCTTVTMTQNQYQKITQLIDELRTEALSNASESSDEPVKVVQLNFQLYPLTNELKQIDTGNTALCKL